MKMADEKAPNTGLIREYDTRIQNAMKKIESLEQFEDFLKNIEEVPCSDGNLHPTKKMVGLVRECIQSFTYSEPGDARHIIKTKVMPRGPLITRRNGIRKKFYDLINDKLDQIESAREQSPDAPPQTPPPQPEQEDKHHTFQEPARGYSPFDALKERIEGLKHQSRSAAGFLTKNAISILNDIVTAVQQGHLDGDEAYTLFSYYIQMIVCVLDDGNDHRGKKPALLRALEAVPTRIEEVITWLNRYEQPVEKLPGLLQITQQSLPAIEAEMQHDEEVEQLSEQVVEHPPEEHQPPIVIHVTQETQPQQPTGDQGKFKFAVVYLKKVTRPTSNDEYVPSPPTQWIECTGMSEKQVIINQEQFIPDSYPFLGIAVVPQGHRDITNASWTIIKIDDLRKKKLNRQTRFDRNGQKVVSGESGRPGRRELPSNKEMKDLERIFGQLHRLWAQDLEAPYRWMHRDDQKILEKLLTLVEKHDYALSAKNSVSNELGAEKVDAAIKMLRDLVAYMKGDETKKEALDPILQNEDHVRTHQQILQKLNDGIESLK